MQCDISIRAREAAFSFSWEVDQLVGQSALADDWLISSEDSFFSSQERPAWILSCMMLGKVLYLTK